MVEQNSKKSCVITIHERPIHHVETCWNIYWQDTTIEIPIKCKLIVKLPFSDPCAHVLQINLGNSPFSMVKPPGLMLFLKHFTHSHGHSKGIQNHPKASKIIQNHPKSSSWISFFFPTGKGAALLCKTAAVTFPALLLAWEPYENRGLKAWEKKPKER